MDIYVVIMYRYGNMENHSYLLGVYDDLDDAKEKAAGEFGYRGRNKYHPHILKTRLNATKVRTVVVDAEKDDIETLIDKSKED